MATTQWNDFSYYIVGNQVQNGNATVYVCILANQNIAPPNATYWVTNAPAATGLTSLNGLGNAVNNGILTLSSNDKTINITPDALTGFIDLTAANAIAGVSLIVVGANQLSGAVTFVSPSGTVTLGYDPLVGVTFDVPIPVILAGNHAPLSTDWGNNAFYLNAIAGVTATTVVLATIKVPDQSGSSLLYTQPDNAGQITFYMSQPISNSSTLIVCYYIPKL